jgi:hypothetical protein
MGSHRTAKSHVTAWVLAVVAVPVLYVLSAPPLVRLSIALSKGEDLAYLYSVPYRLAVENTPLEGPLQMYIDWWFR